MANPQTRALAQATEKGHQLGRLGEFVGFRMRRVHDHLLAAFVAATSHYGLRSGVLSSLALIEANPGLSQQELSVAIGLDKSITVQIVDELERRGWAKRTRSVVDRRRQQLSITTEGITAVEGLFKIMAEVEAEVLAQLGSEDRLAFDATLDRMYDIIYR